MQELQNERNVRSKEVGIAKAAGKNVDDVFKNLKELSDSLKTIEEEFNPIQIEVDDFLARLPNLDRMNLCLKAKSEDDNQVGSYLGRTKKVFFYAKRSC